MIAMRNVFVPALSSQVSAIGFGCASLGSRVARDTGLKALERAYEAGVTWYDVAPSYGDGEAETNLSDFLVGKRSNVQVCTKVGILPAQTPWLMRKVKPIARSVVGLLPGLRRVVAVRRPLATKTQLNPTLIRESLHGSLRRLGTDYVDVLALHGADEVEVANEDVLRVLEDVVKQGKVRTISVASSLDAGITAHKCSPIYGIVQVANNPFEPNVINGRCLIGPDPKVTFVSHSAYGSVGALERLRYLLTQEVHARQDAESLGYAGSEKDVAAAILIEYALKSNRYGICLLSMFNKVHLEFNLRYVNGVVASAGLDSFIEKWICSDRE